MSLKYPKPIPSLHYGMNENQPFSAQLLKGTFETIILKLLSEKKRMYGYEISQKVRELSEETINLTEGSLYPILHKLVEQGLLTTELEHSGKRPRRYYRLTETGTITTRSKVKEFKRFVKTMGQILSLDVQIAS